jgi:hypothetical protein
LVWSELYIYARSSAVPLPDTENGKLAKAWTACCMHYAYSDIGVQLRDLSRDIFSLAAGGEGLYYLVKSLYEIRGGRARCVRCMLSDRYWWRVSRAAEDWKSIRAENRRCRDFIMTSGEEVSEGWLDCRVWIVRIARIG